MATEVFHAISMTGGHPGALGPVKILWKQSSILNLKGDIWLLLTLLPW